MWVARAGAASSARRAHPTSPTMPEPYSARASRAGFAALLALVAACDRAPTMPSTERSLRPATHAASSLAPTNAAALAQLGQHVFEDRDLSLQRNQSCATCHDAAFGFTSPDVARNGAGAVVPGSVASR